MDPSTLFTLALGLTPPWEVWNVHFSPEERRLDISIGFPLGSLFTCPVCGSQGAKAYDTWVGVLNRFHSRLTTGLVEGFNSLLQAAKARARGYTAPTPAITMATSSEGNSISPHPRETAKSRV